MEVLSEINAIQSAGEPKQTFDKNHTYQGNQINLTENCKTMRRKETKLQGSSIALL